MEWNWQQAGWPHFQYDLAATEELERDFLLSSGSLVGVLASLKDEDRDHVRVELLSDEGLLTSKIEGEILDRDHLQSSLQRYFGLKADTRRVPPAEQGVSELLMDVFQKHDEALTQERLLDWHAKLMMGRGDIAVGAFRSCGDPMQVVSGPIHDPRIHFEAPPAVRVEKEMRDFLSWWECSGGLPALARAAIAHLYFESIHPFEDGNGRIGRALSELSLSQSIGQPMLLALSKVIEGDRKVYYDELARANRGLVINEWISYFSQTMQAALKVSQRSVEFLVEKAHFFDRFRNQLNSRQEKVLLRVFSEGVHGFQGGLSASNYQSIAKTSSATATRDLAELVTLGALRRTGERKYTRYRLRLLS